MSKQKTAIAACVFELKNDANNPAIQLFPAGNFSAPRGSLYGNGTWKTDEAIAQKVIAAASRRKNNILIDYEHQSLKAAENGQPVPAAGWINPSELVWQVDGIYAQSPNWTAKAAAMIDADEYRYLSPVFTYDEKTGAVLDIISVALTNTPAIDGMSAISLAAAISNYSTLQENPVDELMERLRYLLNLPLTTTSEEMLVELDKLKTMLTSTGDATAAASLPALLSAKDAQIAALKTATPDPAKFVPVEALLAVQQQAIAATTLNEQAQIAALIAEHPTVIIPSLKPWAEKQSLAALTEYIGRAKPLAALSATQTGGKPPADDGKDRLSSEEVAVCNALGLAETDFTKGDKA